MKRILHDVFPIIIIAILGATIYSNALTGPFQFDDHKYILNNSAIKDLQNLPQLWERLDYRRRLVAFLSFALNYKIHGQQVAGYHITNVVIHILSAIMVWWFVLQTFSTPALVNKDISRHKERLSLLVALLFLSHPIQTQAVTYISQRFTSLATFFYLSSICLYIKARLSTLGTDFYKKKIATIGYYLAAIVVAVLGLFTKEIVFTLPIVILLYEFYFLKSEKNIGRSYGWCTVLALISLFGSLVVFFMRAPAVIYFSSSRIPTGPYLFTQFRVIITYIRLLLLPIGQNLEYDYPLSYSLLEWPTLLSLITILTILYVAIKIRQQQPLVSFGVLWFFFTLSIESSFIPIRDVINEHRLYLPSIGFCLMLTVGLYGLIKNYKKFITVVCVIIVLFSFLTYQRNKVWQDGRILWQDVVDKSPQDVVGHINLASEYYAQGKWALSIMHLDEALKIYAKTKESYFNRMKYYIIRHQWRFSRNSYYEVILIGQQEEKLYTIKGNLAQKIRKQELANESFKEAQKIHHNNEALTYYHQAFNYFDLGDMPKVRQYMLKGKTADPFGDDWLFKDLENALSTEKGIDYEDPQ